MYLKRTFTHLNPFFDNNEKHGMCCGIFVWENLLHLRNEEKNLFCYLFLTQIRRLRKSKRIIFNRVISRNFKGFSLLKNFYRHLALTNA